MVTSAASGPGLNQASMGSYGGASGNEVVMERITRSGQKLFYRLEVIQQPERARACGSGPKSSADRRPVDPPPVVELRVFTGGDKWETSRDITFNYNANFFLFATLEHARVMAHGRVQTPAANTPPVLTGMPVSGMAYLDRPQEAGYFLFPDLSVRHEGRYRLTFNLFEQTKEDKDFDKHPSESKKQCEMDETFDWRMEVKSNEFMVFSAKKFPGLTESTTLSRTVAEQGCRVRIRRDVRMRRREGKSGNDDYSNDAGDEFRHQRSITPEMDRIARARSMSSESAQRTPFRQEARRTSGVPPPFGAAPASGHLAFGGQQPHHPPQTYPREPHAQPSSVPPSPPYAPGPAAPYPMQAPPQHHQEQVRPPSQHVAPEPSPQRESFAHPYQRPRENSYGRSYPPPPPSRESMQGSPTSFPPLMPPSDGHKVTLPPLSALVIDPSLDKLVPDRALPPISPTHGRLPSIMSQGSGYSYSPPASLGKRSFDQFSPAQALQQFKNGTRPAEEMYEERERYYARADGRAMRVAIFPDGS